MRCALLAAALTLALCADAGAQVASDTADARRDGVGAAERASVGARTVLGFLGGVPLGFAGPLALLKQDAPPIAMASLGAAAVAVASRMPVVVPDSLRTWTAVRGDAYRRTFEASYVETLRDRYRAAALRGAVPGAVIGSAVLVYGLLHLTGGT